jgi:hypothetical protein
MELNKKKYKDFFEYAMCSLKTLRKLTSNEISEFEEPYRMLFYSYYGYLNKLKQYNYENFNIKFKNMFDVNYMAIINKRIKILKYLDHINVNKYTYDYIDIIYEGSIKLIKYFESTGININIKDDTDGSNAFLLAINYENIRIIKYLVSKDFNIHYVNYNKESAFLIASCCERNDTKILKYLESIGLNIHIKDIYMNNAYLKAAYNGDIKYMKYLESRGININCKNIYGLSAYNIAFDDSKTKAYILKNKNYKLNQFSIIYFC